MKLRAPPHSTRANRICGGLRRPFLLLCWLCLLGGSWPAWAAETWIPRLSGEWWPIAQNPDLGELNSPKQQPVDFAVWQAADGSWQLWSCIRQTREPGHTRLFYGWQGQSLSTPHWQPRGIQMHADTSRGEQRGGLQAPYVKRINDQYHLFYGDWARICLALSADGKSFRPAQVDPGLFGDVPANNVRDPMLLLHEGRYYCYYTTHPDRVGRVLCRTSTDLKHWSEPVLVRMGGAAGHQLWSHECPHVVVWQNRFYLFTTQAYTPNPQSTVYVSDDPLAFGVENDDAKVTSLPVAAPELIRHEDQWFIAALNPALDGIRVARLTWEKAEASGHLGGGQIQGILRFKPDPANPWRLSRYYIKTPKENRLAEGVVALRGENLPQAAAPAKPALHTVDQVNFMFVPETVAIRAGDSVKFTNSDDSLHNVMTNDGESPFNVNMPKGDEYTHTFRTAGALAKPVRLGCVYHGGMRGWIYVFDHPYFQITGPDGQFGFQGLPPGDYTLEVVHPAGRLSATQTVHVHAGQTERVEITLEQGPNR